MSDDWTGIPRLQGSKTRWTPACGHLVILLAFAVTLAIFHLSYDFEKGKGSVSDGLGNALGFLAVAYYVRALPALWIISRCRWFGSLLLPTLMMLVIPYFYFTFLVYYIQPTAAVMAFFVQLIALIVLSCQI